MTIGAVVVVLAVGLDVLADEIAPHGHDH